MAKMYGDRGRECHDSPDNKTKTYFKHREETSWQEDFLAELEYEWQEQEFWERHAIGICKNPKGGYGCDRCYFDDGDGPEALDFIDGVTYNERR